MSLQMPEKLKSKIESEMLGWTFEGSDQTFQVTQEGARFSIDFADWQGLTLDELTTCVWGGVIGPGDEFADYAAQLRAAPAELDYGSLDVKRWDAVMAALEQRYPDVDFDDWKSEAADLLLRGKSVEEAVEAVRAAAAEDFAEKLQVLRGGDSAIVRAHRRDPIE